MVITIPRLRKKRPPKDRSFRLPRREGETDEHYHKRFHRARLIRRRIPICFLLLAAAALVFSIPLKLLLNAVVDGATATVAASEFIEDVASSATDILSDMNAAAAAGPSSQPPVLFFFLQLLFLLGFEWVIRVVARKLRHRSGSPFRLFLCKLVAFGLFVVLTAGLYFVLGREIYLWLFSVTAVFNTFDAFMNAVPLWRSLITFYLLTGIVLFLEPLYTRLWHTLTDGFSLPRVKLR